VVVDVCLGLAAYSFIYILYFFLIFLKIIFITFFVFFFVLTVFFVLFYGGQFNGLCGLSGNLK